MKSILFDSVVLFYQIPGFVTIKYLMVGDEKQFHHAVVHH